jgi:hypothetical protein
MGRKTPALARRGYLGGRPVSLSPGSDLAGPDGRGHDETSESHR